MRTKFLVLLLCGLNAVYGQQESLYTQYMYNTVVINPAYAGLRGGLSIFALHRNQWQGFEGAPVTNNLSANMPTSKGVGVGLSFIKDKIGPSDESNLAADFSYGIPVSAFYKLTFGVKASVNLLNIDFSNLRIEDNDYAFATNIDNEFSPNVGVGVYLNSDHSYFGLSAPRLLKTNFFDRNAGSESSSHVSKKEIHYYFIAGTVFDLNAAVQFKPSIISKFVQGSPFQVDLSGNFLINKMFVGGLSYRFGAEFSTLLGFQTSKNWFIGYSYDMPAKGVSYYTSGSHEFFLRYEFENKKKSVVAPSFF